MATDEELAAVGGVRWRRAVFVAFRACWRSLPFRDWSQILGARIKGCRAKDVVWQTQPLK